MTHISGTEITIALLSGWIVILKYTEHACVFNWTLISAMFRKILIINTLSSYWSICRNKNKKKTVECIKKLSD